MCPTPPSTLHPKPHQSPLSLSLSLSLVVVVVGGGGGSNLRHCMLTCAIPIGACADGYRKVRSHRAPYLTIRDVVSGTSTVGSPDNVCEVILRPTSNDPPGVVCFETELTCEIRDDNPITRFPFDRQELSIEFEMPGSSSKNHVDHGRVLLPVDVQIRAAHDLLTWNYHTMRAHVVSRRGQQQHVVIFCRVTRRYISYLYVCTDDSDR